MYSQFQYRPSTPRANPGYLTFLKNFGQIPRYVASLDGQMPHPLELRRGSNPPPSRHVTHEINEYKQNRFLVQLVFAPHFKQRHIPRYNYIKRQSKNCEILLFPTADRRFDTKIKCPTGRASFWVKSPTVRSLTRVKCPEIARGGGGMGGFRIDWYINHSRLTTKRQRSRELDIAFV